MPQSPKQLQEIGEETSEDESRLELEDTRLANQIAKPLPDSGCEAVHGAMNEAAPNLAESLEITSPNGSVPTTSLGEEPNHGATILSRDVAKGKAPESLTANMIQKDITPGKIYRT